MLKIIEKIFNRDYNINTHNVNNGEICEPGNPYGHVLEFNKLSNEIKKDAHRVISNKALRLYSMNKIFGSATDINGNRYDFDIFQDAMYRITGVEKCKNNIEEVLDEKYFEKDC